MINVLILGSKEYPFGTNTGDDPIPSGGMETYVDDLSGELSKLCKVSIITRKFKGTEKFEKISKNITVYRVPWIRGKFFRNPSFNKFSFFKALKLMKHTDIVYSNGIISGFSALMLAKLFGKKAVYRPAGIGFSQFKFPLRQILYVLELLVMKKSDAIVFHSDGEMGNAEKLLNTKLENATAILTGFPVKKFSDARKNLSNEFGIGSETVITTVARFVPVKGLNYLIDACSRLKGNFKLLMVGSGPDEKKLKDSVAKLGMGDKVIFAGFRRDVESILATSDIYVISSLSEGLPTSLLEAMAAGKACVVTNIGLPVKDNITGLVVKPQDVKALQNAIDELIENKSLAKKLGENAKAFVLKNCTQEIAARKHFELFSKLMKKY